MSYSNTYTYGLGGQHELTEQAREFNAKYQLYKDIFEQQKSAYSQQGGIGSLIDQYQKAFAEAKFANEQKYQQQLGAVSQTSGQQRTDVLSQYQQQRSNAMQQLARTGLANTTIAPTLQSGIQREQQAALNRVSDQELAAKLGVMQNFEYKYPEQGITQSAIQAMANAFSYPGGL